MDTIRELLLGGVSASRRIVPLLLLLAAAIAIAAHPAAILPAMAQAPAGERLTDEAPAAKSSAINPKQRTMIDSLKAGGTIGVIIIVLSVVALGFCVEHSLSIRKSRILPEIVVRDLEKLIGVGRVPEAIDYCNNPRSASLAADVVLAGLERYQASEFGFAEYKSAVEEAGEEATAKLYRKIDALNLIGVISPMLGLLGTVQGMIEAFNTIASRSGQARPDELADSISKALVTTLLGLIVAIPAMVAYSYFRNKIDSLVAEAGKRIERIMMPLARRR